MDNYAFMGAILQVETARLLNGGNVHANPRWHIQSHAHAFWEFIYFLEGCGRIELPGEVLHAQQYHLVVYPPGLPHEEASDPHDPEETLFFAVAMDGVPPLGAHLMLPDQDGQLRWLCEHLMAEYQATGVTALAETYLRAVLLLVERTWESGVPVPHDAVDVATQYLHAHYAKPISLRTLAEVTHVSATHLVHCFTARHGLSPMQYLKRIRVDAATRLLCTTDQSVQDIAAQVGFHDPLYFSRVMKQATGHCPTELRSPTNSATFSMPGAEPSIPR